MSIFCPVCSNPVRQYRNGRVMKYCSKACQFEANAASGQTKSQVARQQIMDHYGSVCAMCGTDARLQFHHAIGDGKEARGSGQSGWASLARHLDSMEWPSGYISVLCATCHADAHRRSPGVVTRYILDSEMALGLLRQHRLIELDDLLESMARPDCPPVPMPEQGPFAEMEES
jgi:hypothetical protein